MLRAAIADNVNELNQWTIEADARSMLNKLGFYDYDEKVEHMSGGQKKRIALVNALLTPADILVLDEPTNHLQLPWKLFGVCQVKSRTSGYGTGDRKKEKESSAYRTRMAGKRCKSQKYEAESTH